MSFPFAFNAWRSLPFVVSLFLLIFTLLVVGNWIGYIASDDAIYLTGAYGLLEEFPYLGGHGTFRFIITGPIALSLSVFGENEVALALPSFFYALALTVLVIHTSKKAFGPLPAVISAGLLVTSPLLVVTSSIASVDVIEAFFVFASVAFFLKSAHMEKFKGQKSVSNLILAGVMAGFAFLTRETTVFLLVFYGFLFLWGIGIKRLHHFIMAAGFFLIWGLESLYFWVFSGDPFYRFTRSVNHDSTIDRTIDVTGNFIVHPVIDPLFVLLFNQEFGFLFWGVIGFGIWWIIQQKQPSHAQQGHEFKAQRQSSQGQSDKERSGQEQFGQKQSEQRQVAQQKLDETGQKDVLDALGTSQSSRNDQWFCETAEASIEWQVFTFKLLAGLGVVWFLCVGGVGNMLPLNPRYFLISNIAAIIIISYCISAFIGQEGRYQKMGIALFALIVAGNIAGLWLENKNFLFAEKALAKVSSTTKKTIVTDAETFHRVKYLLKWNNASDRVKAGNNLQMCELYFHNRKHTAALPENIQQVQTFMPDESIFKPMIAGVGLYDHLPAALRLRLDGGHQGAALYKNTDDKGC